MTAGTTARERDKELSLVQHLGELRTRLVVSAIALVITTALAFAFGTQLIRLLLIPVDCTFIPTYTCHQPPTTLVSFSPTENFTTYFRVALFAGFALAMPVILYEIYAYIDPALSRRSGGSSGSWDCRSSASSSPECSFATWSCCRTRSSS